MSDPHNRLPGLFTISTVTTVNTLINNNTRCSQGGWRVREGGELITFCMTFVLIIISSIQTLGLMDGESGLIISGSIEGGEGHHHYHCAVLC